MQKAGQQLYQGFTTVLPIKFIYFFIIIHVLFFIKSNKETLLFYLLKEVSLSETAVEYRSCLNDNKKI